MEQFFLSCLQAQLLIGKINSNRTLTNLEKNDLVWEIKQVTRKSCFKDAKAD